MDAQNINGKGRLDKINDVLTEHGKTAYDAVIGVTESEKKALQNDPAKNESVENPIELGDKQVAAALLAANDIAMEMAAETNAGKVEIEAGNLKALTWQDAYDEANGRVQTDFFTSVYTNLIGVQEYTLHKESYWDKLQIVMAENLIHAEIVQSQFGAMFYRGELTSGCYLRLINLPMAVAHKLTTYADVACGESIDPFVKWCTDFAVDYIFAGKGVQYAVTTSEYDAKCAFASWEATREFLSRIVNTMTRGLDFDMEIVWRKIINDSRYINTDIGYSRDYALQDVLDIESRQTAALDMYLELMYYRFAMNDNVNALGVFNSRGVFVKTPLEEQVLICDIAVYIMVRTILRAYIRNPQYVEDWFQNVIVLDDMTNTAFDTDTTIPDVNAIIVDRRYVYYYTLFRTQESIRNPRAVGDNTYLTFRPLIGISSFANAVAFQFRGLPNFRGSLIVADAGA